MRVGGFHLTAHLAPQIQLPLGVKAALVEVNGLGQRPQRAAQFGIDVIQLIVYAVGFQFSLQPQLLPGGLQITVHRREEGTARLVDLFPCPRDAQHGLLQ